MFYTYILRSISCPNQRYIGSTSDLRNRLKAHNAGEVPHTAKFKPWKVETYIAFETVFEIRQRSCFRQTPLLIPHQKSPFSL